jgi:restriction system protein
MKIQKINSRRKGALDELFGKGVAAIVVGVFLSGFTGLGGALKPLGALAFLLGVILLGLHFFLKPKPSEAPAHSTVRQRATQWSPAVFAAIEWRRFEAVCEALFAQAGFKTRSQSHGADGGVDIWLHSANTQSPVAVVQCKHWHNKPVGVKEIREFFGVMASHQLKCGTYATTSTYTADAQQFAKDNGINAMDGNGLLAQISKRTPEQQQALLDVAYEGEYWRPTCASCGIKMVERRPTKGGAGFWGCSHYPKCKSRFPMEPALR